MIEKIENMIFLYTFPSYNITPVYINPKLSKKIQ